MEELLKWIQELNEYERIEENYGLTGDHLEERRNGYRDAVDDVISEIKHRIEIGTK